MASRVRNVSPRFISKPPFAEAERYFLVNCTRCDKCIAACDFIDLFKLPGDQPHAAAGTPAMDLLNRGCHMCADSCPLDGALDWRGGGRPVINSNICSGCGRCREACIVTPKAVTIALLP